MTLPQNFIARSKLKNLSSVVMTIWLMSTPLALKGIDIDYSVVSVPEESGLELTKITGKSDYVCMPQVIRRGQKLDWFSNRVLALIPGKEEIAYLSFRNNATNIFIKDLLKQGGSRQRTNRTGVIDFSFSPNGKDLYFSETRGNTTSIFQTNATNGFVCRQITSGANDYSPVVDKQGKQVFFTRTENNGFGVWSYNLADKFLASYAQGLNPYPVLRSGETSLVVSRPSATGQSEIWKFNYETGVEECLISDPAQSFTSPIVSPDGEWILFVGSSFLQGPGFVYPNTDLYVCRIDGTDLRQLTHHAADDISPVWSNDGHYIYFVSQRGDAEGTANIWRMTFRQ